MIPRPKLPQGRTAAFCALLVGLVAVAVGVGFTDWRAGIITGGIELVALALAILDALGGNK